MDGNSIDLADAFDAVSDLYGAETPCEAAAIVARTLHAMISAERIAVYLYDIDEDVMRRVAGDTSVPVVALGAGPIGRAFLAASHETVHEPCGAEEALLVRTVSAHGRVRGGIVVARPSDFGAREARLTDYVADRFAESLG
jgi:hypothetical protein